MPTFTNSFNIDTDHPILLQGSQNAQLINKIFGYSLEVTNHVSSQAVLNQEFIVCIPLQDDNPSVYVGDPLLNSYNNEATGGIYKCRSVK